MRFHLDRAGIELLSRERGFVAHMAEAANVVAQGAAENTPVRSGHMRGGWVASAGSVDSEGAVASVGSTDGGAVAMEVGSVNNAPHAMVSRAVNANGLRLRGRR